MLNTIPFLLLLLTAASADIFCPPSQDPWELCNDPTRGHFLVADPNNCSVFYSCQLTANNSHIPHKLTCLAGKGFNDHLFNENFWRCDYRENVPRCSCTQRACSFSECFSAEGCPLIRNNLLTTLPQLNKEFFISFEFKAVEFVKPFQNLIHFTQGGDHDVIGDRVPGVWAVDDGHLHITFAVNGNHNFIIDTTKQSPVDEWQHVEISQALENDKYIYRVHVYGSGGVKVENSQPKTFSNVRVFASDDWYSPLKGYIRNLFVNAEGPNKCVG